jgi:3-oxoacyl-[acyl-carrier protein] reductase
MQEQRPWILVTGGARGIGRALVDVLSLQYRVVFTFRQSSDEAHRLADQWRQQGRSVEALCCDGTDGAAVREHAQRLITAYGAPHALVNNAGITRDGAFLNMDAAAWRDVVDNNLNATYHWTRALLQSMVEAGHGTVVMMSSVSGIKGNVGQTNYGATKAALIGFTKSLALETARFGVRINAIAPGIIETDMLREMPEKARVAMSKSVPMKRAGETDDVASMVEYLISDKARYVTGQCFVIDGGLTA